MMIDASWRAWAWFWFGHCISRLFLWCDRLAFMYPVYHWAMCRSMDIQDAHGLDKPWGTAKEGEDA